MYNTHLNDEIFMSDFSNYYLRALDINTVAGGVVPEMAHVFGVALDQNDLTSSLGQLVGAMGQSKVLQENTADVREKLGIVSGDAVEIAAGWLEKSGVMKQLDRSLWTPELQTPDDVEAIVVSGAVANWQDRAFTLLVGRVEAGKTPGRVYIPVGDRVMNSPTELTNPNIVNMADARQGSLPTETDYAEGIGRPLLQAAGYRVEVMPYSGLNGDQIAERFVEERPGFFDRPKGKIAFARVANAGIMLATQFRQAAHAQGIDFDKDPDNPQLFILTDTFPIAKTEKDAKNAAEFQNPLTAMRQIAVTAKHLQIAHDQHNIDIEA